jgi:hypothetical protein
MRNRKPVNVRVFSMLHNMVMFWASLYMVIETLRQVTSAAKCSMASGPLICDIHCVLLSVQPDMVHYHLGAMIPAARAFCSTSLLLGVT